MPSKYPICLHPSALFSSNCSIFLQLFTFLILSPWNRQCDNFSTLASQESCGKMQVSHPYAGCRVQGAECRLQGSFRVHGAGCRVQSAGCRVQGSGSRVQCAGFSVQGPGSRVQGSGFRLAPQESCGKMQVSHPETRSLNPTP